MKSSTIRRANLSKEKMAVLEALSKFNDSHENDDIDEMLNSDTSDDGSPEVYVRPNKEKELDMLWKDFRIPKVERSPIVYLGIGFAAGVVVTLLVSACIGMSSGNFHLKSTKAPVQVAAPVASEQEVATSETTDATTEDAKNKKFGLFGSANNEAGTSTETAAQQTKEYEVQSGDTMEKIVRQFYGSYSGEKVEAIMNANNMQDANKLSIGQKLLIPVDSNTSAE